MFKKTKLEFIELRKEIKRLEDLLNRYDNYCVTECDKFNEKLVNIEESVSVLIPNFKTVLENVTEISNHKEKMTSIIRNKKWTLFDGRLVLRNDFYYNGKMSDVLKCDEKILYEYHDSEVKRLDKENKKLIKVEQK